MSYKQLMGEVSGIIEARKPKIWHQQSIGREGLMKLVKLGAITAREMFGVPQFVKDSPFNEKMWWKAVDTIWGKQEMWASGGTKKRGVEHEPNFSLVVRTWKKMVANEYGFEPTKSSDRTLTQHVKDEVSRAAKLLGAAAAKARKKASKEEWTDNWMGDELNEDEWPHFDESILDD